jgi:hypothetical protein
MTTPLKVKTLSVFFITMTILPLPCSRDKIWAWLGGDRCRGTLEHGGLPRWLGEGEDSGVVLTGVKIGQARRSGHDGGAVWELASAWGKGVGMLGEGEATTAEL